MKLFEKVSDVRLQQIIGEWNDVMTKDSSERKLDLHLASDGTLWRVAIMSPSPQLGYGEDEE